MNECERECRRPGYRGFLSLWLPEMGQRKSESSDPGLVNYGKVLENPMCSGTRREGPRRGAGFLRTVKWNHDRILGYTESTKRKKAPETDLLLHA